MKYIVTQQTDGKEEIFIFPNTVHHDCMAEILGHIKDKSFGAWKRVCREPVSAGFVKDGQCVGESESLGISSRPQDTDLLASGTGSSPAQNG
jgi:hypothetical protein